jgi:hypothetical protein
VGMLRYIQAKKNKVLANRVPRQSDRGTWTAACAVSRPKWTGVVGRS